MDTFTKTKPGESFIYFTGDLTTSRRRRSIGELALLAWRMATETPVQGFLTQRKVDVGCEYIFTKAKEDE